MNPDDGYVMHVERRDDGTVTVSSVSSLNPADLLPGFDCGYCGRRVHRDRTAAGDVWVDSGGSTFCISGSPVHVVFDPAAGTDPGACLSFDPAPGGGPVCQRCRHPFGGHLNVPVTISVDFTVTGHDVFDSTNRTGFADNALVPMLYAITENLPGRGIVHVVDGTITAQVPRDANLDTLSNRIRRRLTDVLAGRSAAQVRSVTITPLPDPEPDVEDEVEPSAGDTVWVVTISHRHGIDTHLAGSEAEARATVHGYVAEWWGQEIPDGPMPDDPEAAVAAYFEQVEDEWAEITTVEAPRPGA